MKNLLSFLSQLEVNNRKEWMDANRAIYKEVRADFIDFVQELIDRRAEYDKKIESYEPKHCMFRINRNIRFSKDKRPYKNFMAAEFAVEGAKKSWKAGYYVHLEPGNSLIAGGIWSPDGPLLRAIRNGLRTKHKKLKKLVSTNNFLEYFGEISGELVKTTPKGFKKGDPGLDLIRKKSFHFFHKFTDKEVFSPDFEDKVVEGFAKMTKINHFLNNILDDALVNGELDERLVKRESL